MRNWAWPQQCGKRGLDTTPVRWGMAAVPVGGRAWPDNESTRRAKLAARTAHGRVATHRHTQRPGTTGVEGAGGTGGHGRASRQRTETHTSMPVAADVEGRRRDRRAWLRCPWAAAGPGRHHTAPKAPPAWRAPEGPVGLTAVPVGGGGAWPGFETTRRAEGSRRGRLAGGPPPTGTPSSPAQQHTTRRPERQRHHKKHSTGARAHRPAPLDATTQTRQLRSTCVPYRSARAARQWRRSSRSPRLRRRAGPRR